MSLDKQERLAQLTDEVGQLHPLLKRLLPKLPTILHVDYTHKSTEMGADFVVSRKHEVFGDTEYVGVIAKIGKVVQDYSGIERQIQECWVPRTAEGGKKKVRLNEVWVVLTEHITKGAQDKIHDKYEAAKIEFLPGGRLAELIDRYIPDYWTDIDLDIGEYLSRVREHNAGTDRALSLIHEGDGSFYIEQDVVRVVEDDYSRKARRLSKPVPVDFMAEIVKHKVLVLEGGMGSGKSKLLRHAVAHFTTPEVFLETKVLPIHLTYKELADGFGLDLDSVIEKRIGAEMKAALPDGVRYLFLIDAVDEKDQSLEDQIEAIRRLTNAIGARQDLKGVITSRYLSRFDSPRSLSIAAMRYELRSLSLKRVIQFLTKLCSGLSVKARLLEDLKKSPLFRELPKSPIAAILLAQLFNERSDELPSNMTELYAKYMELMLGRWDIEKGLQSQKEYEALDNILMSLATFMVENDLTMMSDEEGRERFASYLSERQLGVDSKALFERAIGRSEILAQDPFTKAVSFKHRTFAEFFHAKALLKKGVPQIDGRVFQPYWINVYFFLLGLQKDSPDLLRGIIALQPVSEGERIVKFVNMGNYLLAAYSTPYSIVADGVTCAIEDAARFYLDVINGRSESFFTRLPRMTALWLLQTIVREVYSYTFLKPAIEEAALRIDDGGGDKALRAYGLFLLNVAYIDLGATETFDFLLKRYTTELPIDVALAVKHEGERRNVTSDLMKRHIRRVAKVLKGDRGLQKQLKALYEQAIRPARPPNNEVLAKPRH